MEKTPKACEPCRRRKVRCNGQTPCQHQRCQGKPTECTYRVRTRIRKSNHRVATSSPLANEGDFDVQPSGLPRPPAQFRTGTAGAAAETSHPEAAASARVPETETEAAHSQALHSVTASHGNDFESTENSRLFYGPSSQFAFLQQVYRGILSSHDSRSNGGQQGDREVQEGGPGLDLFLQRTFFFGTPSRVDASLSHRAPLSIPLSDVCLSQATAFMGHFKAWSAHPLPLFSNSELDRMLHNLYSEGAQISAPSQTRALTLAVLAIGALSTPHTNLAEMLFARAKQEAAYFDDTVSLPMIQFSLLLAEYQTNMGRPSSTYLKLGTACRKAFALGLHKEAANSLARSEDLQRCRTILWCLYSQESWFSLTVGRESALKMADISSPFPDHQPVLASLCRLAHLAEKGAKIIYGQRYDSLRKLYVAAENIHSQLREFAETHGMGSAGLETGAAGPEGPSSLMLHNLYYHTILLTFRPFLVADYALASSKETQSADTMWLRQACRHAIDAAQDSIVFTTSMFRRVEACKTSRYNAFFLESSCAVLIFDILRHPSKQPYNVEYIEIALKSLDEMIDDEPVTNARRSVRRVVRIVEETIARNGDRPLSTQTEADAAAPAHTLAESAPGSATQQPVHDHQQYHQPQYNAQFPSLNGGQPSQGFPNAAQQQQLIYFSDLPSSLPDDTANGGSHMAMPLAASEWYAGGSDGTGGDPLSNFHYDVVTTDLFNFFPLNMTPPSDATNFTAGSDNS